MTVQICQDKDAACDEFAPSLRCKDCPTLRVTPPLKEVELDPAGQPKAELTMLERKALEVLNTIKAASDGGLVRLPEEMQMGIDVVLMMATVRRVGVA